MNRAVSTALGMPLAIIVWLAVFLAAFAVLSLWDFTRGLSDDFLQSIFREWFTPGLGGYAAMHAVNRWLPNASLRWDGVLLCAPLVLFYLVFPIYIILFRGDDYDYVLKDQIMQWGMAICTCVGSYIGFRSVTDDS